jgi:hypothetical protein
MTAGSGDEYVLHTVADADADAVDLLVRRLSVRRGVQST